MELQVILLQSANKKTVKRRLSIAMYINSTYIGQKNQLSLGNFIAGPKLYVSSIFFSIFDFQIQGTSFFTFLQPVNLITTF